MRKDMILGMSIGGILLLLVISYLALAPKGSKHGPAANLGTPGQLVSENPHDSGEAVAPAPTLHNGGSGGARVAVADPAPVTPPGRTRPVDTSWERSLGGAPSLHAEETSSMSTPPATHPADSSPRYEATVSTPRTATSVTTVTPAPLAGSSSSTTRTHVVRAGETPSSIAAMAYGSANFYPYILRANPGLDPHNMKVGQVINLPDPSVVHPAQPATLPSAARDVHTAAASPVQNIDPKTHYVVESGDSLYKISIKLYGNSAMVQAIYDLNKDEIGPDQRVLKVHQVLKLPKPLTAGPATQQ